MKKFLIKLSYTVLPLWLLAVGVTVYYNLRVYPNLSGDLGVLGKVPFGVFYQAPQDSTMSTPLYTDVSSADELRRSQADVLVCGDSFSQQGSMAWNSYLARYGHKVLNMVPEDMMSLNPLQTAYELLDGGYADSANVGTMIVETVERSLVFRLMTFDAEAHTLTVKPASDGSVPPEQAWSLLMAKQFVQLNLKRKGPVRRLKLDAELFSGSKGDRLFFYQDDVDNVDMSLAPEHAELAKSILGLLFDKARQNKVRLVVLVCPDKYDLYQHHVVGNSYQPKTVCEDLRRVVGSRKDIVIAKELLLPLVDAGQKDVYLQNDSHWSYGAARLVAGQVNDLLAAKEE